MKAIYHYTQNKSGIKNKICSNLTNSKPIAMKQTLKDLVLLFLIVVIIIAWGAVIL